MSKKKTFTLSPSLNQGLTDTINIVENHQGLYRNAVVPVSRVELDPNNPRKLHINLQDILHGISASDKDYQKKEAELAKLTELSESIKISGVINPITLYKHDEHYRIIAGERRYLACLLSKKTEIEARIFHKRPGVFELKLIQWFENTGREDLTLVERLGNIRDIIEAHKAKGEPGKFTINDLAQLTGLSYTQAEYYVRVVNANEAVLDAINRGVLNNLDKAYMLAKCKDTKVQTEALALCEEGVSFAQLKLFLSGQKSASPKSAPEQGRGVESTPPKRGRVSQQITLGKTKNIKLVKTLVDAVLSTTEYRHYAHLFSNVTWDHYEAVNSAFKNLVKIIESEEV